MKTYKEKSWLLLLALPLVFGQLGCKKFLDRKPLGAAVVGDVQQGATEEKAYGLYAAARNWGMSQLPYVMLHSARADDAIKGSAVTDGSDMEAIVDNFEYNKDHWMLNAYWDDHYSFISLANDVIHDVDSLQLTDPQSIINKAEATFMRAYAYFDLVRTYGEVPKIDFKIFSLDEANIKKATVPEIYALIDADLQFASANLPLSWETKFLGRVTKGSANALQAKANLYRKDWVGALAKAEEVIGSGVYELYPNYRELFTEVAENSKESIFEIQNFESDNGSQVFSNAYAQYQGIRSSGEWDLGWGWNTPTDWLVNAYEPTDPRRTATILYTGKPDSSYGATIPSGLVRPYWNKKVYTDPKRRAQTGDRFGQWLNMMVIRYADVLLMAAEAANELGGAANTTKALEYLEQVRARARGDGPAGTLPAITTTDQAELRDSIRHERRVEFGMEFERFFDLVRWEIAETTLNAEGIPFEPRNVYYPLPQGAIDKSGGKLEQNPNY